MPVATVLPCRLHSPLSRHGPRFSSQALLVDMLLKACSARPALTPAAVDALLHTAARGVVEAMPPTGMPRLEHRGCHPDLTSIRALKCVLKHRIHHGSYVAASAPTKVPPLLGAWLAHFGAWWGQGGAS
jgi:hypothetical protein